MRILFFLVVLAVYFGLGTLIYFLMRKYLGICRDKDRDVETVQAMLFLLAWPFAAPIAFLLSTVKSVNEETRPRPPSPLSPEDKLLEKEIRAAHQELKDGRYSKYEDD